MGNIWCYGIIIYNGIANMLFCGKGRNPALAHMGLNQLMGNMEGKEVRFGIAQSSLFTTSNYSLYHWNSK